MKGFDTWRSSLIIITNYEQNSVSLLDSSSVESVPKIVKWNFKGFIPILLTRQKLLTTELNASDQNCTSRIKRDSSPWFRKCRRGDRRIAEEGVISTEWGFRSRAAGISLTHLVHEISALLPSVLCHAGFRFILVCRLSSLGDVNNNLNDNK